MLAAESQIATLNGVRLAGDLVDQGPVLVLTWDGDRVTVGEVVFAKDSRLIIPITIVLDDGTTVTVCDQTMLLLRSGTPRFLDQIDGGTSLLPLYMKFDKSGCPIYQEPGDWHKGALTGGDKNRWRRLSRLVAEWKLGRRCEPGDVVSYLSDDRSNCHPDNLMVSKKKRKPTQKKVEFAEPLFEAQRFIDRHNHKVSRGYLDTSRNLLSIRGLGTGNLAVGGIFVSVDSE